MNQYNKLMMSMIVLLMPPMRIMNIGKSIFISTTKQVGSPVSSCQHKLLADIWDKQSICIYHM